MKPATPHPALVILDEEITRWERVIRRHSQLRDEAQAAVDDAKERYEDAIKLRDRVAQAISGKVEKAPAIEKKPRAKRRTKAEMAEARAKTVTAATDAGFARSDQLVDDAVSRAGKPSMGDAVVGPQDIPEFLERGPVPAAE